MAVAALITWLITAVAGFVMLGIWLSRGGHQPGSGSRLVPGLVFSHLTLAVLGLVVFIVYLVVGGAALAWIAFVLLLPVVVLGFTMLGRWISSRRSATAESRFPIPIVVGHGLFAATTLILVLLTALGVGGA